MRPNPETILYGLIGHPVAHSFGPAMHNAAFTALGLNAVYLAFDTLDPGLCVAGMRGLGIGGLSVTLPHKTSLIALMDRIEENAQAIGALNTVVNREGLLIGYNTDAIGALNAIGERTDPSGKHALILGAGGVARAISFGLKAAGARVTIANRTDSRGRELAAAVGGAYVPLSHVSGERAEIIVQATPLGMKGAPGEMPVPLETLREGVTVLETIYNPRKTLFLERAEALGCTTISGLEMFLRQGAEQLRLWTGLEPPLDIMRHALCEELERIS